MNFQNLKEELCSYYWNEIDGQADAFREKVMPLLDEMCTPEMNGYQRKALQYRTITTHCQPLLFHTSPF